MESARTYQSASTGKLVFRVQTGNNKQPQLSGGLGNGTATLLQEHTLGESEKKKQNNGKDTTQIQQKQDLSKEEMKEVNEWMNAQGKLSENTGIRQIPQVNRVEEYNALEDIRQRCILYLWNLFFGESRANEMADKMGISKSSSQSTYSQSSLWSQSQSRIRTGSMGQSLPVLIAQPITITAERETLYVESETTDFSAKGVVKTADGREISFQMDVSMSRSFAKYTKETVENIADFIDPLVINLNGNIAEVSNQKFYFDLDFDGEEEEISRLCEDSGYLALDKNEDGEINDGSELFGTKSGDGFKDLAFYDEDGNGWIDENDAVWQKLKIWVQDEQGNSKLYSLAEQGVGAICLQKVGTQFGQRGDSGEINAAIRNTGIFLYENGTAGTVQHLDLARSEIAKYA